MSSAALHHGDLPTPEAALLQAVEQELDALADALHDGPVLTLPLVTVPASATCPTITSRPKAAL